MRRSNTERCIDILKVLAYHGPLKVTHIMYKANVGCSVLNQHLDFLIEQNLVEERTVGKKKIEYAITPRAIIVLKYYRELKQMLPIAEESTKGRETVPY